MKILIEIGITIVMLSLLFSLAWLGWAVLVWLARRWRFAKMLDQWIEELDQEARDGTL